MSVSLVFGEMKCACVFKKLLGDTPLNCGLKGRI